jgi:hypothetical protein
MYTHFYEIQTMISCSSLYRPEIGNFMARSSVRLAVMIQLGVVMVISTDNIMLCQ